MYAEVKNNEIVRTRVRPNWLDLDGNKIEEDSIFIANDIYPIVRENPEYDPKTQVKKQKSISEWEIRNDHVFIPYTVEDVPLSKIIIKKTRQIEADRIARTQYMPWTVPSSGTQVQVKIAEEPKKERLTWLSGKANKADSRIRRGLDMDDVDGDKYLIAADDSRHEMTADDWLALGERMDSWITEHVFAAKQHIQAVQDLTTVQDVIDYDFSTGWPS
jgi:hypothetical protein